MHAYFTDLCEIISASIIDHQDRVSLTVEGGRGVVESRISVSLGLIVAELVINALKHAFPDDRSGKIVIDYSFHGPNWSLSVHDDGVGMPTTAPVRKGLGTSIVQALARQLSASIETTPQYPGTRVSIQRTPVALVQNDPGTATVQAAGADAGTSAVGGR
jgi:two-component sensor histidine kinase